MLFRSVPTSAWQLIEHPARAKYDLSSLVAVTYGAILNASFVAVGAVS